MKNTFWTSAVKCGDFIHVRGYKNGERFTEKVKYAPYLFVPKEGGKYRTVDNKEVAKLSFDSMSDAKDFLKRYENIPNFDIYGLDDFLYTYIFDNYPGEIDYDYKLVNVATIDIETKFSKYSSNHKVKIRKKTK